MSQAAATDDASFVTIGIDREVFAVPVETVLEILAMRPVFRIPEAPAHLMGLVDVRGRAVAVIDLRTKLGLPRVEADENTRIVVLDVAIEGRRLALGLVADRVFEVITLNLGEIEQPPDIGTRWHSDYIRGIGRRLDSFVVVLDLEHLFSNDAVALMAAKTNPSATLDGDTPSSSKAA
ncbi:MAG: chemotaxis protein CheW [Xanthobacteraceae bacterium]|nr:chemotaxis protein CheW [Xanthobacteraceae bacterium]